MVDRDPLSKAAAEKASKGKSGWTSLSTIPHDGQSDIAASTTEGTPVVKPKGAGNPTSRTGFPKGTVGTRGSWTPEE
jgi:hypothetical protein